MIVRYFIPLYGSLLISDFNQEILFPIMCLAFIATVPAIIRKFWR